jgi:hypothetical protein
MLVALILIFPPTKHQCMGLETWMVVVDYCGAFSAEYFAKRKIQKCPEEVYRLIML